MEAYFEALEKGVEEAYKVAIEARRRGLDPDLNPETPLAKDLAERVEGLVGPEGISDRIRELDKELSREEAAIQIAREIVEGKHGTFKSLEEVSEQALRTSLAILTEGIVAAPLEGIAKVKIKKNADRSAYLAIYFAGPIRSAGGSDQALAVLIGDYIRTILGLGRFKPTSDEIERFAEETDLYNTDASRLQYLPTSEEVREAIRNIPIEITGEGTEKVEVSGYRDLDRVETNRLRGGAVLVLAEGVLQKAPKILKYVEKLGLEGWDWLSDFAAVKRETENEETGIGPSYKYIKELIAGRPVIAYPSRKGGLRLRYGRCRTSGLASASLHPATMVVLDEFIAVGTQIRTERPGKGAAVSPCDTIEGPIVKLVDGSVLKLESEEEAYLHKDKVKEILFVGDILISYGDFLENNHVLLPAGYCEEWWVQELEEAAGDGEDIKRFLEPENIPTEEEAIELAERFGVPLHPRYTYFYHDVPKEDLKDLVSWLSRGELEEDSLVLNKADERKILETLGVPFEVKGTKIVLHEYKPLLRVLGVQDLNPDNFHKMYSESGNSMEIVNSFGVVVRQKAPTYIGARMGRPEKAKERKMSPPVNVLFPIGQNGGRTRNVKKAAQMGVIEVEIARRECPKCGEVTIKTLCPRCDEETELRRTCVGCGRISDDDLCRACGSSTRFFEERGLEIMEMFDLATQRVGTTTSDVKGVIGMTSTYKIPEALEKGILRARHGVYVFKDGTTRFDTTDVPLTHFRPREVGVSVERLRELGYKADKDGNPLEDEGQIAELKVQDILLPEEGADYLVRAAQFLDDLLENLYGLERFYNVERKEDLIGHLVVGLAPHTSAAILGRIIGFSKTHVGYAHPFFHAAKRRNADGDEDGIFLLLDVLINFSKFYLPSSRGGKMDAPLVLTTRLDPKEIDDEAHNLDVLERYPLEFYEKTLEYARPQELETIMETVKQRLGKPEQYSGLMFTHDTSDISAGPRISSYKSLTTMKEKVEHQLELARKIRAVEKNDVAKKVIEGHFLPDLAGNLRAFSTQQTRCVACNQKYRRVPLSGKCRRCGGKLILTVSRGSVEKYLQVTKDMLENYGLDDYLRQRIEILEMGIASVFDNDAAKQISLSDFLD
ncbi:MAG: DNA polymerase II large subunit [Candidatus Hydrothermarchaeales archaeon]